MTPPRDDVRELRRQLAEGEIDLDDARLRRAAEHDPDLALELAELDEARRLVEEDSRETREVLAASRERGNTEQEDRVRALVLAQEGRPERRPRPGRRLFLVVALAAAASVTLLVTRDKPADPVEPVVLGSERLSPDSPEGEAKDFTRFEWEWTGPPQAVFRVLVYAADGRTLLLDSRDDPSPPRDGTWQPTTPPEADRIVWVVEATVDGGPPESSEPCSSWRAR